MENLAPDMLEEMQKDFERRYWADNTVNKILDRLFDKKCNYKDVDEYAMRIGEIQEDVIKQYYKDLSPAQYKELSEAIVKPQLKNNYDLIIEKASTVQKVLNKKAKIGIKPAIPDFDEDKATGLIEKLKSAESYEDIEKAITYNIQTFNKGIVSDTVQSNAALHYKAGLRPVIKRIAVGKCCKWCNQMAGIYDYESVKNTGNDVYRFHANCRCYILYDPNDGSRRINTKTQQYL